MNNFFSNFPYSPIPTANAPALCVLPFRGAFYQVDTPDWPLTNGFRSDLCSNFQIAPEMAMLCLAPALATVVQTIADVERPNGLVGPTSVWTCVIADPSSRKSTTDNAVNKPTRKFEARQQKKHQEKDRGNQVKKLVINAKKAGYLKAIQSTVMSSPNGEDVYAELAEMLEQDIAGKLDKLLELMPKEKRPLTFIMENMTMEALFDHVKEDRSSKGIITAEGLNAFTGRFMQGQSYLNSIFSGDPVTIHRKTGASYTINDARVSKCIMVQPKPFEGKIIDKRTGRNLRDSGYASRFLFCRPASTQGTRFDNTGNQKWSYLDKYHERMGELLSEALQHYRKPDQPRKVLKFTREAGEYWLKIYNAIELEMGPNGRFARCGDHGGKLAEIIARVAAVFHYFEGNKGDISVTSLDYAMRLCMHCSDCYLDIFDKPPQEMQDAQVLNEWLNTHARAKDKRFILQNEIRQYGPSQLREKNRLNQALFALHGHNCIQLVSWGKKNWIDVFPSQYKDTFLLQSHLGIPK
jgi:hypothetical protein